MSIVKPPAAERPSANATTINTTQAKHRVCLIIVFNHRYDANIPILEKYYGARFDDIRFLVPFYRGDNPRVISVYESSYYFAGYFAQGLNRFFDDKFTHYVFLGDDQILNPRLSAANLLEELKLNSDSAYIKELKSLTYESFQWWHLRWAVHTMKTPDTPRFTNYLPELPPLDEALKQFAHHKLPVKPITWENLKGFNGSFRHRGVVKASWFMLKYRKDRQLPYPLARGYSDLFIVPAHAIQEFCHICGVFAAINLFIEIAVPTALVLTCNDIRQEKDTTWYGVEMFENEYAAEVLERHDYSFQKIINSFEEHQLYLHPIKLSRLR